jgi:hypothetical protein
MVSSSPSSPPPAQSPPPLRGVSSRLTLTALLIAETDLGRESGESKSGVEAEEGRAVSSTEAFLRRAEDEAEEEGAMSSVMFFRRALRITSLDWRVSVKREGHRDRNEREKPGRV